MVLQDLLALQVQEALPGRKVRKDLPVRMAQKDNRALPGYRDLKDLQVAKAALVQVALLALLVSLGLKVPRVQ